MNGIWERNGIYRKKTVCLRILTAAAAILLLTGTPWESCAAAEWTVLPSEALRAPVLNSSPVSSGAATYTADSADERSALHLIAVNIQETAKEPGSLEVSLIASAGSSVKTAGILLEYDYSKLKPIRWDREQTEISVPDLTVEAQEAWRQAEALPSKCPEGISGKPALSFRRGEKGYLYMAAEQQRPRRLEADTLLATVRFAYARGAVPSKDYVASALNFAENRAGMTEAYYSPVRGSVFYRSESPDTGDAQSYYHKALERTDSGAVRENTSVPAGQRLDSSINLFTYVPDGTSVDTRSSEAGDYVSAAFYDWDGTLLGSRIVAKGKGLIDPNLPENRGDYINADGTAKYTDRELEDMGAAPLVPEGSLLIGGTDQSGAVMGTASKDGYVYAGWVDYSSSSTPEVPLSDRNHAEMTGLISLNAIEEPLIVKAAYDEGEQIGTKGNSSRYYTISFSPFRTNAAGTFLETTVTVVRAPNSRRITEGKALMLTLRPAGAGDSAVRVPLGDSDVETYTLSMQRNSGTTYSQEDAVSMTLWDGAGVQRGTEITIPARLIVPEDESAK